MARKGQKFNLYISEFRDKVVIKKKKEKVDVFLITSTFLGSFYYLALLILLTF